MARNSFSPSAPNQIVWIIALILGVLGLIGGFASVDVLTANSFLLLSAGFLLLLIGTAFRGI